MHLVMLLPFVSSACAVFMAAAALLRSRANSANWALVLGMVVLAAEVFCTGMTMLPPFLLYQMVRWQEWRLVFDSFIPGVWLWFSLSYARGNARVFLRRWRVPLALMFLLPVGVMVYFHQLIVVVQMQDAENTWVYRLGWAGSVLNLCLLTSSILILMNLERTFRASVGTMRWRIKFMLIGVGLIFVIRIYTASQGLLFHGIDIDFQRLNAGMLMLGSLLALRSLFRDDPHHLDVYPSQSVLQGSVTILLAGRYLLIVGLFARTIARLGGSRVFELEAFLGLVSLVFFVLLLQSDRLRLKLRRFISRNFQRPLFDYRTIWRRFNEATASQIDQTELCRALVKLMTEVFQALSVAIWLVDEGVQSLALAASTGLSNAEARDLAPNREETLDLLSRFLDRPEPVELVELADTRSAQVLKRMHPSQFTQSEARLCLPVVARGDVIGLIILGDRVGGVPFSAQDLDMLKCIGDHAAASLLNVRLGQRLLQAKELEAFQTMAAFFVHDLKNAASTLSLTLKNLPIHFEDPAFRQDALRGMSNSAAHINHLISRLTLLRHDLKIKPVETDFNELVGSAATDLQSEPDFLVVKELSPLPKLALDREQISKVVTNLVLNAKEAMSGRGRARLTTRREDGWAVLSVRDSGCGMSADFIGRSLFRPFQTTKKNGLGIGMFQSKMIVDVHGGRIAVQSDPGVGTTFEVFLPIARNIRRNTE